MLLFDHGYFDALCFRLSYDFLRGLSACCLAFVGKYIPVLPVYAKGEGMRFFGAL